MVIATSRSTSPGGVKRPWSRRGGLWGSLLVVFVYLAISIPQYGQPYVIDEAAFPYAAQGILEHGVPYFYNGDTRPHDLGLWHPPLYDYLLAGQILIWGMSTFAVRAFGAMCVIASFLLLALALKRIAPDLKQYGYVVLAALFLLNPLVISDALVPDIDGTLGLLVVALGLWVATIVTQAAWSWRLVITVFGLAAIAVSTKFTIAAIVALLIGCAALIAPSQRWKKVLSVVLAFVGGSALSFGLLAILGRILRFDAVKPIEYLLSTLGQRSIGTSGIDDIAVRLWASPASTIVWIGPAVFVAATAAFIAISIVKPPAVWRPLAGLVLASSLGIVLGYSYLTGNPYQFPKYTVVAVPGLALVATLIVALLPSVLPSRAGWSRSKGWLLSIAFAVVLVAGTAATFAATSRYEAMRVRALRELLLLWGIDFVSVAFATSVLVWALIPAGARTSAVRSRRPIVIGVIAALVLAPVMVQVSSSLVNLTSPFSSRYYYRERGMTEFLAAASAIIPPGDIVIAPKDVGLQLQRQFREDAFVLDLPPSEMREELVALRVPFVVTRNLYDYSEAVYPEQFDVLRELYEPILSGPDSDFVLWRIK